MKKEYSISADMLVFCQVLIMITVVIVFAYMGRNHSKDIYELKEEYGRMNEKVLWNEQQIYNRNEQEKKFMQDKILKGAIDG